MYRLFKNSGIQYFGNPKVSFTTKLDPIENYETAEGSASYLFARKLLKNEWVPFSLDGNRNLLRICFLDVDNKESNVFAMDTKISTDPEDPNNFLIQDDISDILYISSELKDITNPESLLNNIPVLDDTITWLESIKERKQNVFDDFIGAAEFLVEKGYTDSGHLTI